MCVLLQDVDTTGSVRHAWWMVTEASRRGYSRVLRSLDVDVQDRGESSYNDMLPVGYNHCI